MIRYFCIEVYFNYKQSMKLVFHEEKRLFLFSCNYFERKIPKKAGFKYSSKVDLWHTGSITKAIKLYEYAGKELQERFDKYKKRKQEKIQQSLCINSDFQPPKPDGLEYDYFDYQRAGIEYANDREYTLIADEMGLGKSVQTVGVINCLDDFDNILIICPNSMKGIWRNELHTWCTHSGKKISINNSAEFKPADIMIINYEAFRFSINPKSKDFRDPEKGKFNSTLELWKDLKKLDGIDLLILDESHRIKNWQANTTRNIFKLKSRIGVDQAIFLTGTPIFSRPDEIWTTIKFFEYEDKFRGTKADFMKYYQNSYFDRRYKRTIMGEPQHLDELQSLLRSYFMIRRTKSQVFDDMPEKLRKIVPVEVDQSKFENFQHLTQKIHDISALSSDDMEQNILSSLSIQDIREYSELRMLAGEEKVSAVIEYVKSILDTGEKVIIFGHHKRVLAEYKKAFPNCAFITGSTPSDDRADIVDRFQNDPDCRVFIGNMISAGVGLTLTASSNVVFAELDPVPANMRQAEDRAHRISQTETVVAHYIVADKTLDAYLADMIIGKQNIFDRMIEKEHLNG